MIISAIKGHEKEKKTSVTAICDCEDIRMSEVLTEAISSVVSTCRGIAVDPKMKNVMRTMKLVITQVLHTKEMEA